MPGRALSVRACECYFEVGGSAVPFLLRDRHSGGSLGGRTALVRAGVSLPLLLSVSVGPAQRLYGRLGDFLLVYGKEKVYGSIP
jgi:hypothetical protein